jgi:hypothetical protein
VSAQKLAATIANLLLWQPKNTSTMAIPRRLLPLQTVLQSTSITQSNTTRQISIGWGGSKSRRRRILSRSSKWRRKRNADKLFTSKPTTTNIPPNTPFSPHRFLNPWYDLSRILPTEDILYDRVESTSRTFGIVAALMGSLSAALLTMNSCDGYNFDAGKAAMEHQQRRRRTYNRDNLEEPYSPRTANIRRRDTLGFIEHVTFTHHVSGTSLLVSWGVGEERLDDFYTACCAGSFYSGVLTTVISSVLVRMSLLCELVVYLQLHVIFISDIYFFVVALFYVIVACTICHYFVILDQNAWMAATPMVRSCCSVLIRFN